MAPRKRKSKMSSVAQVKTAVVGKVPRVAIGQIRAGRFLRVIYVPDPEPDSIFVITAYELRGKPLTAYRRRQRRRGQR
jgi:hypothetical protein